MDYYELLDVARNATEEEIRSAYRRLVQDHHPDHSGKVDAAEFRRIQEAYETLSDPTARAAYNRRLISEVPVRVVSRPASETVYEVHRSPRAPNQGVQEVQRRPRSDRSIWGEFDRLLDQFFDF